MLVEVRGGESAGWGAGRPRQLHTNTTAARSVWLFDADAPSSSCCAPPPCTAAQAYECGASQACSPSRHNAHHLSHGTGHRSGYRNSPRNGYGGKLSAMRRVRSGGELSGMVAGDDHGSGYYHRGPFAMRRISSNGELRDLINSPRPFLAASVWTRASFRDLAFLGAGSYGLVVLAECCDRSRVEMGQKFAVKVMSKTRIASNRQVAQVFRERDILRSIDHPFLLNLTASFADRDRLYLVTPYKRAVNLWTILHHTSVTLPEDRAPLAQFWAASLVEALNYLHNRQIAHRDLKPENVLVDEHGFVTLVDMGLAKQLPCRVVVDGEVQVRHRTFTLCGTVEYLAPEFLVDEGQSRNGGHDHAVDLWAFGCVLFEMVYGHSPFHSGGAVRDPRETLKLICMMKWTTLDFPSDFAARAASPSRGQSGDACQDLIDKLIVADETRRLGNQQRGVLDVIDHEYFANLNFLRLAAHQLVPPWKPDPRVLATQNQQPIPDGPNDHAFPTFTGDDAALFAGWAVC